MTKYGEQNEFIVVKKHFIMLFFRILRLLIVLLLLFAWLWLWKNYFQIFINDESIKYILLLVIIVSINYEFIKLILFIVKYYNNLIIITKHHILILNILLITKDDLEVIDPYKITKIDATSHWVLSNMFWYWTLIIEQQWDTVRQFRLTPNPYKIMEILIKQREFIAQDKKTFIVDEE